jgi:hypothetical protein
MVAAAIALSAAEPGDAEALVALRILAMRESLERIGRFDPVRARERFLSGFSPRHTRHILVDGERAGFVVVKPDGDGLTLDHLYIDISIRASRNSASAARCWRPCSPKPIAKACTCKSARCETAGPIAFTFATASCL